MGRPLTWARANPAEAVLACMLVAAASVLTAIAWKLTFMRTDWDFLLDRSGSFERAVMAPHGEYIAIGLSLAYRGLLNTFGLDPVAFRAVLTLLVVATSALLFVYLRRRVGDFLALLAVASTLLMGAAHQDLLWPAQIGYLASTACGLAALLALEREERRADILACLLLTAGAVAFGAGIAFVVGAAVAIALSTGRRRRFYVVAVPAGLLALWWLGWGREAESSITLADLLSAPLFIYDGLAASIAALLGLSTPQDASPIDGIEWGRALLAVAIVAGVLRMRRLGRVPRSLWVALATAAAFWLLAGINDGPGPAATASRFQYPGVVFVLMIAADLVAGMKPSRTAKVAITAVAALAIISSVDYLGHAADRYRHNGDRERAGLAAIELARATVEPGFTLERDVVGTGYARLSAGSYLGAVDAYGHSPAFTEAELAAAPGALRAAGDRSLAAALRVTLGGASAPPAGRCTEVDLRQGPAVVTLAPGGASLSVSGEGSTTVRLRRFAAGFPVVAGALEPDRPAALAIAPDLSAVPWQVQLAGGRAVKVCALAG